MIISDRSKEIIEYLLNANDYISVDVIAKELNVTKRTIYREMPEINKILESCNLKIDSVNKKGMQILGSMYNMRNLEFMLENHSIEQNYTNIERQNLIALYLVHQKDFIKTQSLAIDLNTSTQTIRNDLSQIKNTLEYHDIKLITKKSEGIIIEGKELSKRHLLISILLLCIPLDSFFDWLRHRSYRSNPYIELLKEWNYEPVLQQSYQHINSLIDQKRLNISDKEYQELLLLLSVFVLRHKYVIDKEDPLKLNFDISIIEHELYDNMKNFLKEAFHIDILPQEDGYFNWLLNIYTGRTHYYTETDSSLLKQLDLITKLISLVEERFNFPFHKDENLPENLMLHVGMTLERIRSGISVSNPLNDDIEQSNPKLYQIVDQSFREVFSEIDIPNDEVGYIAIYFMAAMDSLSKQSISVLVVCASGMGSSKMLRSRLEREFSEIKVKKIISLHKITNENVQEYDMIVSTIPLDNLTEDSYICVSPLLNEEDKLKTKKYITNFIKKGEHNE